MTSTPRGPVVSEKTSALYLAIHLRQRSFASSNKGPENRHRSEKAAAARHDLLSRFDGQWWCCRRRNPPTTRPDSLAVRARARASIRTSDTQSCVATVRISGKSHSQLMVVMDWMVIRVRACRFQRRRSVQPHRAMLRWGPWSAPVRSRTRRDGVARLVDASTKLKPQAAICMKSGGPQHDLQVALPPFQHLHEPGYESCYPSP
ncbi:hypothetical protein ACQKWADRAFT_130619 [Trichoderma austrokoningii]